MKRKTIESGWCNFHPNAGPVEAAAGVQLWLRMQMLWTTTHFEYLREAKRRNGDSPFVRHRLWCFPKALPNFGR